MQGQLPKVFVCYASADNKSKNRLERWLDRVLQHLEPFNDDDGIKVFSDNELSYGEGWHERIQIELQQARVTILLVSAAFMASKYIQNHELPLILYRAKIDGLRIVPVLISPSAFDAKEFRYPDPKTGPEKIILSQLQSAGTSKETLTDLAYVDQERILTNVARFVAEEAKKPPVSKPDKDSVEKQYPPSELRNVSGGRAAPLVVSTDESKNESLTLVAAKPPSLLLPKPPPTSLSNPAGLNAREFVNSLGMRFLPVDGTQVQFCIWPTRLRDYAAYTAETPGIDGGWKDPVFEGIPVTPGKTHPVVMVSWDDAKAFCRWLTKKERENGKIGPSAEYRLPTDLEWSIAVGLKNEKGSTPKEKDEKIPDVYPWGTSWPPPPRSGNFADRTFVRSFPKLTSIGGYNDGYATTSPVGTYPALANGLFDLSGNVWEWCEDWYDGNLNSRVLRGGSWFNGVPRRLLSSCRFLSGPTARGDNIGFRIILIGGV